MTHKRESSFQEGLEPTKNSKSVVERLVKNCNLQDLANHLCKELPEGWAVKIVMENGAAWVEVEDPYCKETNIEPADSPLIAQALAALDFAEEHKGEFHF